MLKKKMIKEKELFSHLKIEAKILRQAYHPGINKLHFAFQTEKEISFVNEYAPGGDLYNMLQRNKKQLPEYVVKFYTASVVLAIDYLHKFDIVFRDLRPENIIIG